MALYSPLVHRSSMSRLGVNTRTISKPSSARPICGVNKLAPFDTSYVLFIMFELLCLNVIGLNVIVLILILILIVIFIGLVRNTLLRSFATDTTETSGVAANDLKKNEAQTRLIKYGMNDETH